MQKYDNYLDWQKKARINNENGSFFIGLQCKYIARLKILTRFSSIIDKLAMRNESISKTFRIFVVMPVKQT